MKYLSLILAALLPLTLSAQTKLSDLIEGTTIVATDLIPFVDVSDTTQAATGTTKKATAGVLASQLAQLIAPTWNNGATDFTALKVNVTNTASGSGSKLMDLNLASGGDGGFHVEKNVGFRFGRGGIGGNQAAIYSLQNTGVAFGQDAGSDVYGGFCNGGLYVGNSGAAAYLYCPTSNILAQRNGTNVQESHIYKTFTDDNNFKRLELTGALSGLYDPAIVARGLGSGVNASLYLSGTGSGSLYFCSNESAVWAVNSSGHLVTTLDNARDIGASSERPRNLYLAGDIDCKYLRYGSGSPEGVVTADVGAIYRRTDGGAGTTLYVKESGTGNTGWVAK